MTAEASLTRDNYGWTGSSSDIPATETFNFGGDDAHSFFALDQRLGIDDPNHLSDVSEHPFVFLSNGT